MPTELQPITISKLPPHLAKLMKDKLVEGLSSRAVSQWLTRHGYKLSHTAINRYNKKTVRPALRIGAKIQAMQALETAKHSAPGDAVSETQEITRHALDAEPIMRRVNWLQTQVEQGVQVARDGGDLRAWSSMLSVARGAIETEAKARMHPGFVPSAPVAGTTNNIVVVMPMTGGGADPAATMDEDVIDVDPL